MSDLENMSEVIDGKPEAVDVVVTDTDNDTPPNGIEEGELTFIEDEDAPNETSKENDQLMKQRAAFAKSKQKQREEKEKREAAEEKARLLEERLNKLESSQAAIQKGKPPTLASCDYDEEDFENKTREYYSKPATKPVTEEPKSEVVKVDDESEFYYYQKANDLRGKLPNYDELEGKAKDNLKKFGNPDIVIGNISMIARQKGIDVAKAIAAFGMSAGLVDELGRAASTNNQFAIADVIDKAAKKIQPRQNKKIDTQPEPTINSGGPIDNSAKAVEKARQAWVENGSVANYNALKAARAAAKQ